MDATEYDTRINELFLLQRVAQRINSILDLEVLLEEVVSDVVRTFGYTRSAILLKDEEANELEIAAVRGWTINYHMKGDRFKIGEYGMVGHVGKTGETYYAPDVTVDPYYQVSEESTRSELDIPLKVHDRLIGVFNFQHQETDAFPAERIRLLQSLADHVATAIENARLFQKEHLERERMTMELDEAHGIQASLFPAKTPDLPGFEIQGLCLPCREVGGDWFDFIPLQDGRLGLVLADVAGKGMGAALLMASTRSILRVYAEQGLPPSEVLGHVNRVLVKDFPSAKFVTMIYAIIDPLNRTVVFSNAGHMSPLLMNSTGVKSLESKSGLPLGIEETQFEDQTLEMLPGSRLLFYSDGVNEAMNAASEEYGMDRIYDHMKKPYASNQSLLEDVQLFTGNYPASDDITIVMIETLDSA